jgi:hypothetical protein
VFLVVHCLDVENVNEKAYVERDISSARTLWADASGLKFPSSLSYDETYQSTGEYGYVKRDVSVQLWPYGRSLRIGRRWRCGQWRPLLLSPSVTSRFAQVSSTSIVAGMFGVDGVLGEMQR